LVLQEPFLERVECAEERRHGRAWGRVEDQKFAYDRLRPQSVGLAGADRSGHPLRSECLNPYRAVATRPYDLLEPEAFFGDLAPHDVAPSNAFDERGCGPQRVELAPQGLGPERLDVAVLFAFGNEEDF
jgi:hypothetical protein